VLCIRDRLWPLQSHYFSSQFEASSFGLRRAPAKAFEVGLGVATFRPAKHKASEGITMHHKAATKSTNASLVSFCNRANSSSKLVAQSWTTFVAQVISILEDLLKFAFPRVSWACSAIVVQLASILNEGAARNGSATSFAASK
jgi:hypothetical protein